MPTSAEHFSKRQHSKNGSGYYNENVAHIRMKRGSPFVYCPFFIKTHKITLLKYCLLYDKTWDCTKMSFNFFEPKNFVSKLWITSLYFTCKYADFCHYTYWLLDMAGQNGHQTLSTCRFVKFWTVPLMMFFFADLVESADPKPVHYPAEDVVQHCPTGCPFKAQLVDFNRLFLKAHKCAAEAIFCCPTENSHHLEA